jgi:predicted deacylase
MSRFSPDPDFSDSYAQARERFLQAAAARGARIEHHPHPLTGIDGEALAADVASFGAGDATDVLLLHSGTHGVEGHCGAGIQHALLTREEPLARALAAGFRVVLLHAINPWGFSWSRRVTEDNVDLNRNFRDFTQPGGPDPAYDEVHPLLLPAEWPWSADNQAAIGALLQARGAAYWQFAITHGQRSRPDGLFFAGNAPTWSNRTMREVLRRHAAGARRLFWIDVHTGLGASGVGEMIYAGRESDEDLARTRGCWGEAVTSTFDGSSSSAQVGGQIGNAAYDECPGVAFAGIGLEFGTWPLERMLEALRFDQWVRIHAADDPDLKRRARRTMREMFFVDTPEWKRAVLDQGIAAFERAIATARASPPGPA